MAWLDLAKLAAMFLVIYNHLGIIDEHVRMWISSFHVPAFFFISGLFIKPRREFGWRKNACQLLVPTVLWFLILWVTYNVVVTKIQHPNDFFNSWLELFTGFFAGTTSGSGWFLIALFWIRLMLWRIILLPRKHQWWVVALVTGVGVYLSQYPELNRYHIVNALTALPFTYMGYLMAPFLLRFQVKRGQGTMGLAALLAVTVALSEINGNVGSLSLEMGHYWWLSYLQGLLGAMLLLLCCNLLRDCKVLSMGGVKTLSQSTLLLFLAQWPYVLVAKVGYKKLLGITLQGSYVDPLHAVLLTALILLAMYPLVVFVRRRLPLLAGIYKKKTTIPKE